jgi:hypothetical protein
LQYIEFIQQLETRGVKVRDISIRIRGCFTTDHLEQSSRVLFKNL